MYRVAHGLLRALALGPVAFACLSAAAVAQEAASATSAFDTDNLRPGQYHWNAAAAAADGPVSIVVSLPVQRVYVFRAGALIGYSTISSGQPGYDTPTGTFTILEKDVVHHSNRYENAPMPFMQRLTWDGVALHAGQVAAEPASHGCIRLPRAFAERLFAVTRLGGSVVVSDQAPVSAEEALALSPGAAASQTEIATAAPQ